MLCSAFLKIGRMVLTCLFEIVKSGRKVMRFCKFVMIRGFCLDLGRIG